VTNPETGIAVVFYHPDDQCVRRANRFADFGLCVVVDNTERTRSCAELGLDDRVVLISNGDNLGIATALNQGIEYLIDAGCQGALLFDQDSEPTAELLVGLPRMLADLLRDGRRVALLGPAYDDVRLGGVAPFVRFGFPALKRIGPEGSEPIEVDFLISSASCLNLGAWRDIGPMDDSLFIDFVDVEWCVRARAAHYSVLGTPLLSLQHSLGGEPIRVLGRAYPSHSPLRHYYLFRNATNLIMRGYMPWTWKWTEIVAMPVRLVIYGVWLTQGLEHVRMSCLGIWHGLRGTMGAYRKLQRSE
jgi:rhamnosyltransferase